MAKHLVEVFTAACRQTGVSGARVQVTEALDRADQLFGDVRAALQERDVRDERAYRRALLAMLDAYNDVATSVEMIVNESAGPSRRSSKAFQPAASF